MQMPEEREIVLLHSQSLVSDIRGEKGGAEETKHGAERWLKEYKHEAGRAGNRRKS